jgi:hypothetical protein
MQSPNLALKTITNDQIILSIPAASKWMRTPSRVNFLVGATNNW